MQAWLDNNKRLTLSSNQRGAALLMLLLILLLGAAFVVMGDWSAIALKMERDNQTHTSLAVAKDALIAWSVLQGDIGTGTNPRPGTLPCPDTNDSGLQAASCSAAGGTSIGRLPWKTLGIEDVRDADGERLWYAVSNNFRRTGTNNKPINSDTQGTLLLYASNGIKLLTPTSEQLAAVIFSPGAPLAGQDRKTYPNKATSYLEAANNRNNAIASGPFIAGPIVNAQGEILLNDRLLTIAPQELIVALERRVLKEVENALAIYAAAQGGKYPNPAKYNGTNCSSAIASVTSPTTCRSSSSVCFGRLPEDVLGPHLPTWFLQNGWGRLITYAANKNNILVNSAAECSAALNVDGSTKDYVVLTAGAPKNGQTRPSIMLASYLENSANNDAWTSLSAGQDSFTAPHANSNDQLRSMP